MSLVLAGLLLSRLVHGSEPSTAQGFDIKRYMGTWYEIARFPERFERGCQGVTATYALRPDGDVDVVNTCRPMSLEAKAKSVRGKAWVPDPTEPAKLKVQFFWPFRSDYWVFEVGPTYEYAVVGDPDLHHLWILCRTPRMSESLYRELADRQRERGFDVSRLERTLQAQGTVTGEAHSGPDSAGQSTPPGSARP